MPEAAPSGPDRLAAALADRYRIERELGAGGMATVYLAEDLKHARQVAVKVIRPEFLGQDGGDRFQAEIRTTATLNHPNILALFDSGGVEGHLYYVMPVVEGETLQQRLEREGTLSAIESGRIAAAAARALAYAHERGIIHRDIKPSNLMLHHGQTLVADFGIALVTGADRRLTATGLSLGTPHYMSPEQLEGSRALDGRSDQYALGCVLFEMLEGHPPFPKPTAHAVLAAHLTQPAPHLSATGREARALDAVIQRAMAKDPAGRFPSMLALAEAVEGAIAPVPAPDGSARRGLVVLPFTNMSPDPNDAYFSDGLTEEVIGDLSRVEGLRVISRTSAMRYKASTLALPAIAAELGVRYALEGSVRKAGDRLRVSAQLIDTASEEHLWADKYDGTVDDVFAIQDRVAGAITGALSIVLTPEEKRAMQDRRLPDAEALQLYMQAQAAVISWNRDRLMTAIADLEGVLAERGDQLQLLRGVAYLRWQLVNAGISSDPQHLEKADEFIRRMEAIAPDSPYIAAIAGLRLVWVDPTRGVERLLDAYQGGLRHDLDVIAWLSAILGTCGCMGAAERFRAEVVAIDPAGYWAAVLAWLLAAYRGRWSDARGALETLPPEVEWSLSLWMQAWTEGASGADDATVIRAIDAGGVIDGEGLFPTMLRMLRAAHAGEVDRVAAVDDAALEGAWIDLAWSAFVADICAKAGDRERALRWVGHAVDLGLYQPDFLMHQNAYLAGMRDDPAFRTIVKRAQLGVVRLRALVDRRIAEPERA